MQQHETALGAALKRSGFDTGVRLHAVMARIWADEKGDEARAPKALWIALEADLELRMEAMRALLSVPAEDMHGNAGAGSPMPQGQKNLAPVQNGDGAGHHASADEGQPASARPSPQSREAGAISRLSKGQGVHAPSREPSAAAVAAKGRAALRSAQTVLDSFRITMRQGSMEAVGDIRVSRYPSLLRQLGKRAWVSSREFNLIYLLNQKALKYSQMPDDHTTRDVFKASEVEDMIEAASALADRLGVGQTHAA